FLDSQSGRGLFGRDRTTEEQSQITRSIWRQSAGQHRSGAISQLVFGHRAKERVEQIWRAVFSETLDLSVFHFSRQPAAQGELVERSHQALGFFGAGRR